MILAQLAVNDSQIFVLASFLWKRFFPDCPFCRSTSDGETARGGRRRRHRAIYRIWHLEPKGVDHSNRLVPSWCLLSASQVPHSCLIRASEVPWFLQECSGALVPAKCLTASQGCASRVADPQGASQNHASLAQCHLVLDHQRQTSLATNTCKLCSPTKIHDLQTELSGAIDFPHPHKA
jgi:hypothetical protein